MAVRWSRMELYLSVLTCRGLFATIRERFQYAPAGESARAEENMVRPGHEEDSLVLPRYYDYAGAVHVHSTYSDGAGTVDEIAEAANEAGLDFVVLSDHSNMDARRNRQDGWRGRTLLVVGTEITTDNGHLLALNVPDSFLPAPGDSRTAQQRIVASGGIGFIALPCDLKDRWSDFAIRDPRIGLEVFNLSAIARTKINVPTIALAWSRYRGRKPHKAFHWIAARPARELRLWDELICGQRDTPLPQPLSPPGEEPTPTPSLRGRGPYNVVVGIGSIDAHGVMKFGGRTYHLPTYAQVFRTLRTHVLLQEPLSYGEEGQWGSHGSGEPDLGLVHGALASGHSYIAYDNYADGTGFVFECVHGNERALMGDSLFAPDSDQQPPLRIVARVPKTRSFIRLYRDGKPVAVARGGALEYVTRDPGAYRVEAFLFRQRIGNLCVGVQPWIFSNPIYVQPAPLPSSRSNAASMSSGHFEKEF